MPLERVREDSQCKLAERVHALRLFVQSRGSLRPFRDNLLFPACYRLQIAEVAADVARACCEDHAYVPVCGLGAQCWAEDAEEVEVGQVVCLPFLVDAVDC